MYSYYDRLVFMVFSYKKFAILNKICKFGMWCEVWKLWGLPWFGQEYFQKWTTRYFDFVL